MKLHRLILRLLVPGLFAWNTVLAAPAIRLHTGLGVIEAELFADKAPASVANFLKYVDAGRYTVASSTAP